MGKRTARIPSQQRGIDTKEQIIKAAYDYICRNGFSKLTTPKLARAAGVSIGCFYGYFKDKEDLFQAVLDRYTRQFDDLRNSAFQNFQKGGRPLQEQLMKFLEALILVHESSKELNAEMKQFAHRDKSIRFRLETAEQKTFQALREWLKSRVDNSVIADSDAYALLILDLVNSLVDRVTFGPLPVSKERLLKACIEFLTTILRLKD